jgi:hypothetical protein
MRVKRKIDTKHILDAFTKERELWLTDKRNANAVGAMGTFLFQILKGQRVKDKKNGIELNIPEWLSLD